jgi:hypothetical protein
MSRSRSSKLKLAVLAFAAGLGGCVSSGVLQNAEVLSPGTSAGGIKLARVGGSMQALATYRRGVMPSMDLGVDLGLSMVRVEPKLQLVESPVAVAVSTGASLNLSLRDVSYPNDEKSWVLTGIAGLHPAFIIGYGRAYLAASGSYYPSHAGWRPTGTPHAIDAPRWLWYGVTLGYQSSFGGPDSSRIAAEIGVVRFPGWKTAVMPSLSLQFPLRF